MSSYTFQAALTWSFILVISLIGICDVGWKFKEQGLEVIKTESMNKMIKTRCLLKRACATEAQTGISKRENGSSRLSSPIQNDQAFHLSLPPSNQLSACRWPQEGCNLRRGGSCNWSDMWRGCPREAACHPHPPAAVASSEAVYGTALQCPPWILTSYFKEVKTQGQKVVSYKSEAKNMNLSFLACYSGMLMSVVETRIMENIFLV